MDEMTQQETVDASPAFPEVLRSFEAWAASHQLFAGKSAIFLTDGPWDIRGYLSSLPFLPFLSYCLDESVFLLSNRFYPETADPLEYGAAKVLRQMGQLAQDLPGLLRAEGACEAHLHAGVPGHGV